MEIFSKTIMKPLNSANANFVLSIESQTQRRNQAGDSLSNTYLSSGGNIYNDNSIYVVFEFKAPEGLMAQNTANPKVYASYPNMKDFRTVLDCMYDKLGDVFSNVNGVLVVKPEYSEPYIVSEIGQSNNWVSFRFVTADTSENGIVSKIPAVEVKLSTAEGYASILNLREFKSLVYVFDSVNLTLLNWISGYAFLNANDNKPQRGGYNQQRTYNNYQGNNYQGNNGGYSSPKYGQTGFQRTPAQASQATPQRNMSATEANPMPFDDGATPMKPIQPQRAAQPQTNLAPRANAPIVNMAAVSETPVDNFNFDDTDAIDEIFNGN